MAVMIRLSRQGAKKNPNYLIVVSDKSSRRDGSYIQKLGQYFPKEEDPKNKVRADIDAIQAWQAKGAQLSQTVGQLLKTLAK